MKGLTVKIFLSGKCMGEDVTKAEDLARCFAPESIVYWIGNCCGDGDGSFKSVSGSQAEKEAKAYKVEDTPSVVVVNADDKVVGSWLGDIPLAIGVAGCVA